MSGSGVPLQGLGGGLGAGVRALKNMGRGRERGTAVWDERASGGIAGARVSMIADAVARDEHPDNPSAVTVVGRRGGRPAQNKLPAAGDSSGE